MERVSEFFVRKEDVDLLVAGRANTNSRPEVGVVVFIFGFLFASGLLAGDKVMLGELGAIAIA